MNNNRVQPVLDAIREPAALLDHEGRIIAANAKFTTFECDGGLAGGRFGVGTDYLQNCAVTRESDGRVGALLEGARDVLAGRSPSFTHEFECGPPTRNFELVLNVYEDESQHGALAVQYETTDRKQAGDTRRAAQERLEYVSELMPGGYWDWDIPSGYCYYSPRWRESLGYGRDELPDHIDTFFNLVHPDDVPSVSAALHAYWERRTGIYSMEYRPRMKDGSYRWSLDQGRVLTWDANGKPLRMVGLDIDIHDRKIAELTIKEQARRLMEMSTPLIPITEDIVVMPLIGIIDGNRAQQIMSSLLDGLSQRKAKVAIMDITGVSEMDTHVASVLVKVAKAVQLLGARIVLTGIRPEVATILVRFDIDWGGIVVRSTLQSGIAYATGVERS